MLGDATVLAAFRQHDEQLSATVLALLGQLRAADAHAQLLRLSDQQAQVRNLVLSSKMPQTESGSLTAAFVALGDLASACLLYTSRCV